MLQNIRNKSKGWISWVIVVAISIPFALWGIENFNDSYYSTGEETMATLGDHDVSYQDFYRDLVVERQRLQQEYGDNYNLIDQNAIKENVLRSVLGKGVVYASAIDYGLEIGEEQIRTRIMENPEFLSDDLFDQEKYRNYLERVNVPAKIYEKDIKKSARYRQYIEAIINSNFVTKNELETISQLHNHQRQFSFYILPWQQYQDLITVEEEDILEAYNNLQADFQVPERVKAQYIKLSLADLAEKIEVEPEQIEQFYEERKQDFSSPELRRARHILFEKSDYTLATKTRDALTQGESFSELAEKHSMDTVSAQEGGDLGFFSRGDMVESFEETAFSLPVGEISELVETEFGYHIIEVVETTGGITSKLDDIFEQVKLDYRLNQAAAEFYRLQEELADISFTQPDTLIFASEQLGLPLEETDWFQRDSGSSSDTITQYDTFRNTAFDPKVLVERLNSSMIEIGTDEILVLRVLDRELAYVKPLDTVRDSITQTLLQTKSSDKLLSDLQTHIKDLRATSLDWSEIENKYNISDLSSKANYAWIGNENIDENTDTVMLEIYQVLFNSLRVRSEKDPVGLFHASKMTDQNIALLHMTDSRDSDLADGVSEDSDAFTILKNIQQNNDNLFLVEIMQKRYPIPEINREYLQYF